MWKNWSAWLKGGIIGTVSYIFLIPISIFVSPIMLGLVWTISILITEIFGFSWNTSIHLIVGIFIYFILGALIGLIIDFIVKNTWKSWVKGGIIVGGIALLYILIVDLPQAIKYYTDIITFLIILALYLFWLIVAFVGGAIIGFIIGKIKSKKNKN